MILISRIALVYSTEMESKICGHTVSNLGVGVMPYRSLDPLLQLVVTLQLIDGVTVPHSSIPAGGFGFIIFFSHAASC